MGQTNVRPALTQETEYFDRHHASLPFLRVRCDRALPKEELLRQLAAAAGSRSNPLRRLELEGEHWEAACRVLLAACPQLSELKLCDFKNADLPTLALVLRRHPSVISLDLSHCTDVGMGRSMLCMFVQQLRLERLDLSGCKLSASAVKALVKAMERNKCIVELIYDAQQADGVARKLIDERCGINRWNPIEARLQRKDSTLTAVKMTRVPSAEQMERSFKLLATSTTVRSFDVGSGRVFTETHAPALINMLTWNRSLTQINLADCGLSEANMVQVLLALKTNPALTDLDLSSNLTVGTQCAHMLSTLLYELPGMTSLALAECDIDGPLLAAIMAGDRGSLRSLNLRNNLLLTTAGAPYLQHLLSNPLCALTHVDLRVDSASLPSGNADVAAALVAGMETNKTITSFIYACRDMSAVQKEAIDAALHCNRALGRARFAAASSSSPAYSSVELSSSPALWKRLQSNDPTLREVCLVEPCPADAQLQRLFGLLAENEHVRSFQALHSLSTKHAYALADMLQSNRAFETVALINCDLGENDTIAVLHALTGHSTLTSLDLSFTEVGKHKACVTALAVMVRKCPQLVSLNLSSCDIDGSQLVTIMRDNGSVRNLNVDCNGKLLDTDDGARHLELLLIPDSLLDSKLMRLSARTMQKSSIVAKALVAGLQHNPSIVELAYSEEGASEADKAAIQAKLQENRLRAQQMESTAQGSADSSASSSVTATVLASPPAAVVAPAVVFPMQQSASAPPMRPASEAVLPDVPAEASLSPMATRLPAAASLSPEPMVAQMPVDEAAPHLMRTEAVAASSSSATETRSGIPLTVEQHASLEQLLEHVPDASDLTSILRAQQSDMRQLRQRYDRMQQEQRAHGAVLAPIAAERQHEQFHDSLLLHIDSCESVCAYYQHVRLLLLCAHAGACGLLSDVLEGHSGWPTEVAEWGVEHLTSFVLEKLGDAVAKIPLIGFAGSALSAVIGAKNARDLHQRMHGVVLLASSPAELTALIDCVALKLALLQWPLLSDPVQLKKKLKKPLMQRFKQAFAAAADYVHGKHALSDSEKIARADIETLLEHIADGWLEKDCSPNIAERAQPRGERLALLIAEKLLPGLESYEDVLPAGAPAAAPPPLAASSSSGAAPSSASPCSAPPASPGADATDVRALKTRLAIMERKHDKQTKEIEALRKGSDAGGGLSFAAASSSSSAFAVELLRLQTQLSDLQCSHREHAAFLEEQGHRSPSEVAAAKEQHPVALAMREQTMHQLRNPRQRREMEDERKAEEVKECALQR